MNLPLRVSANGASGEWQPSAVFRRTALAGLLLTLLLQLALSSRHQSQTFDEGFHLAGAYRYWQCGDFAINPEHPPLVKLVAAIPIYFSKLPPPEGRCGHESSNKGYAYALGGHYFYNQGLDADAILFRARMAAAIFTVILAITCYLCASEFFGVLAGLIALAMIVFEPNVLANGALITTDVGVSAFMLAAVFGFYRYAQSPTWPRLLLAGLLTGLTFSCKHSGVLIVPILTILAYADLCFTRRTRADAQPSRPLSNDLLRRTGALVVIFLVAILVLWSVYGFRFAARPGNEPMTVPLAQFIANSQEQGTHGVILTRIIPAMAKAHLLPESYLYGFVDVLNVSDPGQPPFLLGTLYPHGRWFYFPVAFLIKSTLAFLILLAIAVCAAPWRRARLARQVMYLVVPLIVILTVSMTSGLNIGYRHVLPMVGFLCVLIAGAASQLVLRNRAWAIVIMGLLLAHAASSLRAFPNYLAYSNEAWGGPSQTYRYLTDANVDWGNGVLQLKQYLSDNGISECWIAYDGAVDLSYYGIPCRTLPGNAFSPTEIPPLRAKGKFIISDLSLSGIEWEPGDLHPYRQFLAAKPSANVAGALLVYDGDFDLSDVVAVTHIARSDGMLEDKPEQALAEAREGLALTPNSVRAHLSLGRALARTGHPAEARTELEQALSMAHADRAFYPLQIAAAQDELRKLNRASAATMP